MVDKLIHFAKVLVSKSRFKHIIAVRDFALLLADIHGIDPRKLELAAIAHDIFRDVPADKLLRIAEIWEIEVEDLEIKHPILLHGKIAAEFLRRRMNVVDNSVIISVAYHTSGYPEMGKLGKALMIADTVGYDRDFPGIKEIREIAFKSLEKAFVEVLKNRMIYAIQTGRFLLPKSVETWNKTVEVKE